MAFDLNQYINSRFKSVPRTLEGIREAANAILNDQSGVFGGGNTVQKDWAYSALQQLEGYERGDTTDERGGKKIDKLDIAYDWISGVAQSSKAERSYNKIMENRASLEKKIANEATNIANILDFSNFKGTPEERASLEANAAERREQLNNLLQQAELIGADTSAANQMVRTASGYIPLSEYGVGNRNRTLGRSGEPLLYRQNSNGTWEVYGSNSGQVYEAGLPDATEAQRAQLRLNAGFAEERTLDTGAPGTAAGTSAGGTGTASSSITGSAAADQYLTAVEQAIQQKESEAASQGLEITPEVRAMYLAQAREELAPYYSEVIRNAEFDLGTTLSRLVEDTRSQEAKLAQNYKDNLGYAQGALQDSGMLYGGVRNKAERELAEKANVDFAELGRSFERSLQDTSVSAERNLGSDQLASYGQSLGSTQQVGRVLAGSPVFQAGENMGIYQAQGGQYGDLNRERTYNEETRANDLETAERTRFSTIV